MTENTDNSATNNIAHQPTASSNNSQAIDVLRQMFEAVQKSNDTFIQRLGVFATVAAFVFGLGTIANGWFQSTTISQAVTDVKDGERKRDERIEAFLGRHELKRVDVYSALDDKNVVDVSLSIQAEALGSRIIGFKTVATFPIKIGYSGSTTLKLNSIHISYSKEFAAAFYSGSDLNVRKTLNGTNFMQAIQMVTGIKYNLDFEAWNLWKSCEEAQQHIDKLMQQNSQGQVKVWPVFEVDKQSDDTFEFDVKFERATQAYGCDHFNSFR